MAAAGEAEASSAIAADAAEAGAADMADSASLRTVLSGHGTWDAANGYVTVPDGTYVTMFVDHGGELYNEAGLVLDQGGVVPGGQDLVAQTFGPGDVIPNYTLDAAPEFNIQGVTVQPGAGLQVGQANIVNAPTTLSQLLTENQGEVWWSACRYIVGAP